VILEQFHHELLQSSSRTPLIPLKHKKLQDLPTSIVNRFSSVLGDDFHVIDHIKFSTHASVRKLFKVALRDALYEWNPVKLKQLEDARIESGSPKHRMKDKKKELQQLMIQYEGTLKTIRKTGRSLKRQQQSSL
jgi:hypothetical protein